MAKTNSVNCNSSGVISYSNSTGVFTGTALTQFDVLVGGSSNAIVSVGPGTAGQVLQSGGAASNPVYSTATYPATAGTSGNVITSNGTNFVSSAAVDLHAANFIVGSGSSANYTTIASAITAASSGNTIFIQPGTYTENLTLKAGVNLTAFVCDSSLNVTSNVIIKGKCTMTVAGSMTISGIQLQTNSDFFLAVTGSAATIVNLNNCCLNALNNTGISFTSSDSGSRINAFYCTGDVGTTGIGMYACSGSGSLNIFCSRLANSGATVTSSTNSSGSVGINQSLLFFPLTSSSTGILNINHCTIDTSAQNTTALTLGGTGFMTSSRVEGGSASALSIGGTYSVNICNIGSSNTNAITGAGTLNYQEIAFSGSSSLINTTTQVGGTVRGGISQAPSTGFLGENFTGTASAVTINNSSATTVTSITLTAGVWDVSMIVAVLPTGTTSVIAGGISGTNNSLGGTNNGIDQFNFTQTTTTLTSLTSSVPPIRKTITTSTTYYLVVQCNFSTGTCTATGRISATRVG